MPATFGRRRQTQTKLRKPILGTRAQFYPRIRTRLVAVARASQLRRSIHSSRTEIVGRAVALTFVWPIRAVLDQANRSQARKRKTVAQLRKPVGRAFARVTAYRIRAFLQAGPSQRRKRAIRSQLRKPVGRAVARAYAYAVKVVGVQAGRSQARRRAIRSKLRKPVIVFVVIFPRRVRAYLAGRAVRDRRRIALARLRRPIGRALARTVPYRIRAFLAGRSVRDRRRATRSLRTRVFGVNFPRIVQRVKVYFAGRSVRDRRRAFASRVRRPVGRAVARAYPYRVRTLLAGRAVRDRRRSLRSRLRAPIRKLVIIFPRQVRAYLASRGAVRDRRRSLRTRLRRPVGRAVGLLRPYAVRTVGRVARRTTSRLRRWRSALRLPVLRRAPATVGRGLVLSSAVTIGTVLSSELTLGRIASSKLTVGEITSSATTVGRVSSQAINAGTQT